MALLHRRAAEQPEDRAYVFLGERGEEAASLSFAALARRARALARRLASRAEPGERALLSFPPGLDFIVAFFACLEAGIIAVPMMPPRRQSARDPSAAILADCRPRLALTSPTLLSGALGERLAGAGVEGIAVSDEPPFDAGARQALGAAAPPSATRADIAFLQYTSGSTSAPKGVVVSHGNLLANLEMIRIACGNTRASRYVSWVPLYHDMGLILNALQAFYVGAPCVLMAPVHFMQRPLHWLRAIHDYRAEVAGGPNFAFDLCVARLRPEELAGIDLSCWKLAFVGAEPVRAETIRRFTAAFAPFGFAPESFWPGYGMAEATLLVSGGNRGEGPRIATIGRDALQRGIAAPPEAGEVARQIVGCGRALAGEHVAIVDPAQGERVAPGEVGEVWVAGENVAQGYWRNPAASAAFAARLGPKDERHTKDERRWLRTGDLAFLDRSGELYITGRIKDIIIIRGINHYPQDIEDTVQSSHTALRRHGGAAFVAEDAQDTDERLVIVQEIERGARHDLPEEEIVATIREAVVREHEIAPWRILLLRPGALPKTTSGKIQRARARVLWQEGALALA